MQLALDSISKKVGAQTWLYDMNLSLQPNAVTVLLGATQAGKTSLMRIMAGLDVPTHGRVLVDGKDVTGTPVRDRNVAMVYQQFINYPSLTVADNIASPLKLRGEKNVAARVRELAPGPDAAGLAGLAAAALAHVRVTGRIGPEALLAYAPRLAGLGLDDVTALMVPVSGFGTKSGQSVTLLDAGLTADLAAALACRDVREYAAQTAGNPRTR